MLILATVLKKFNKGNSPISEMDYTAIESESTCLVVFSKVPDGKFNVREG
jgi:hypothetical protein